MAGPRTKIRQFQAHTSCVSDDALVFTCPPISPDLEYDLNVLRTLIRMITGEERYCVPPLTSLKDVVLLISAEVYRYHDELTDLGDQQWRTPEKFFDNTLVVYANGLLLEPDTVTGYDVIGDDSFLLRSVRKPSTRFTVRYRAQE